VGGWSFSGEAEGPEGASLMQVLSGKSLGGKGHQTDGSATYCGGGGFEIGLMP